MNSQEIFDTEFGHVVFKINKDPLSLRLFQTLEKVQPIWELLKEYEIYFSLGMWIGRDDETTSKTINDYTKKFLQIQNKDKQKIYDMILGIDSNLILFSEEEIIRYFLRQEYRDTFKEHGNPFTIDDPSRIFTPKYQIELDIFGTLFRYNGRNVVDLVSSETLELAQGLHSQFNLPILFVTSTSQGDYRNEALSLVDKNKGIITEILGNSQDLTIRTKQPYDMPIIKIDDSPKLWNPISYIPK